jgi:hypothetical protein
MNFIIPAANVAFILLQVMQFLQERGFNETLEVLSRETKHVMDIEGGGGQLCSILAEYEEMKLMEIAPEVIVTSTACLRSHATGTG